MSRLSIVLAPHSFGLPEFYVPVLDVVRIRGYDIRALHLPSSGLRSGEGRPGKPPTMYDDADYIAREVEKLADAGKDVVLIGHSYAGVPVTQCGEGLCKEARQKEGKPGGLVHLAYLSSPVPLIGENANSFRAEVPTEHNIDMKLEDDGWIVAHRPESFAAVCFSSVPLEEGVIWAKKLPKHSAASFASPLTYAGYKDVPCSYLLCEQDLCVPVKVQQGVINTIEKESGRKVAVTRIAADHVPNVTSQQALIDWIVGLVEKTSLG